MSILPQSEPASRPKSTSERNRDQPWCPRYAAEEISGLCELTCEQFGLVQRFRDLAWGNLGLPLEETRLEQIAVNSCGLSRYKFRKFWPLLKKFFIEVDGALMFERDEEHRIAAREKIDKARESGRLGSDIKKVRSIQSAENQKISTEFSTRVPSGTLQQQQQQQELELQDSKTATAAETTGIVSMAEAVAAAADTQSIESKRKPPEREQASRYPESQKLIATCGRFSDVTPDFVEKLASLAKSVEPELDDGRLCDAIRATFKREKQESAGLWLTTVPAWLRNQRAKASA